MGVRLVKRVGVIVRVSEYGEVMVIEWVMVGLFKIVKMKGVCYCEGARV